MARWHDDHDGTIHNDVTAVYSETFDRTGHAMRIADHELETSVPCLGR